MPEQSAPDEVDSSDESNSPVSITVPPHFAGEVLVVIARTSGTSGLRMQRPWSLDSVVTSVTETTEVTQTKHYRVALDSQEEPTYATAEIRPGEKLLGLFVEARKLTI
jgi:hypothetical protein